MKKILFCVGLVALFGFNLFSSEGLKENKESKKDNKLQEQVSKTSGRVKISGEWLRYKAHAGNLVLKEFSKDNKPEDKASMSYVAYFKEGERNKSKRPITFVFNGGPGSSSVWLHIGMMGPKRVKLNDYKPVKPPYKLVNNEYSILDKTDLVFVDPVMTGYSKPAEKVAAKEFLGVEEDLKSVGEFIRLFVTKHARWSSPKYLAGESYGTTRAAGLSNHLQERYGMYLNGIILISSILDFSTVMGSDLSYALYLPTYAAANAYHNKNNLKNKSQKNAEQFALNNYLGSLVQGSNLSLENRNMTAQELSNLIGLESEEINLSDLRVGLRKFRHLLLKDQNKAIGRFDARSVTEPVIASAKVDIYDPSFGNIWGAFGSAIKSYLRDDLKVKIDQDYTLVGHIQGWNTKRNEWDYESLSTVPDLKKAMIWNPNLKVFVASGIYDLATPYFATDYTFSHLGLSKNLQKNIQIHKYEGGHMMYTNVKALKRLKADLVKFY